MKRYEYEVRSIAEDDLQSELNKAGKDGWRAVHYRSYEVHFVQQYRVILEREIPEPQTEAKPQ